MLVWDHDGEEDVTDTTLTTLFEAVDKDDEVRQNRGLTSGVGGGAKSKDRKDEKKGKKKKKRSSSSSTTSSPKSSSDSDESTSSEVGYLLCV